MFVINRDGSNGRDSTVVRSLRCILFLSAQRSKGILTQVKIKEGTVRWVCWSDVSVWGGVGRVGSALSFVLGCWSVVGVIDSEVIRSFFKMFLLVGVGKSGIGSWSCGRWCLIKRDGNCSNFSGVGGGSDWRCIVCWCISNGLCYGCWWVCGVWGVGHCHCRRGKGGRGMEGI